MSQAQLLRVLEWTWVVFGLYWLIAARRVKAARTRESPVYRVFRLLLLIITFTLLFANWTAVGLLGRHFLPQKQSLAYIGFVLALSGLGNRDLGARFISANIGVTKLYSRSIISWSAPDPMRECVIRFIPEYCWESQELPCWSMNGVAWWHFCCCLLTTS